MGWLSSQGKRKYECRECRKSIVWLGITCSNHGQAADSESCKWMCCSDVLRAIGMSLGKIEPRNTISSLSMLCLAEDNLVSTVGAWGSTCRGTAERQVQHDDYSLVY